MLIFFEKQGLEKISHSFNSFELYSTRMGNDLVSKKFNLEKRLDDGLKIIIIAKNTILY